MVEQENQGNQTGMDRPFVHTINDRSAFVSHQDGGVHEIPRDHLPPGQQAGQPLDVAGFMAGHNARVSGQPMPWQMPGFQQPQQQPHRLQIPNGFLGAAQPPGPPQIPPTPGTNIPPPGQAPTAPQIQLPQVQPLPPAGQLAMQQPPQTPQPSPPTNPYNDAVRAVTAPPMSYAPNSRAKFMEGLAGGNQQR